MNVLKIMAVDFGDARTGLAVCDRTEFLASPIGVIQERRFERVVEQVAIAAAEYGVGQIVVGHPLNMNGSQGPRAQLCAQFAQALRERVELPVVLWDERSTTVSAAGYLNEMNVRGQKRKEVIDEVAAAIILENYLRYRHNQAAAAEGQDSGKSNNK